MARVSERLKTVELVPALAEVLAQIQPALGDWLSLRHRPAPESRAWTDPVQSQSRWRNRCRRRRRGLLHNVNQLYVGKINQGRLTAVEVSIELSHDGRGGERVRWWKETRKTTGCDSVTDCA